MAVYFNGRQLVSPTVETVVFDQAMVNQNAPAQNVLAIIGVSDGGQPKTPLVLGSPGQALEVLKGGELLDAVEKAFAPSVDTGGPIQIIAMRVNPATQSSLNLLNGSAATVISLVSTDYGLRTNNIRVKIQIRSRLGSRIRMSGVEGTLAKNCIQAVIKLTRKSFNTSSPIAEGLGWEQEQIDQSTNTQIIATTTSTKVCKKRNTSRTARSYEKWTVEAYHD